MFNSTVSSRTMAVRSLILAATSVGFLGMAAVAMADPAPGEYRTRHVSFQDLNLSTPEGQRTAYERVHQMARKLCSQLSDPEDLGHQPNFVACVESAITTANTQLQALINRQSAVKVAETRGK